MIKPEYNFVSSLEGGQVKLAQFNEKLASHNAATLVNQAQNIPGIQNMIG